MKREVFSMNVRVQFQSIKTAVHKHSKLLKKYTVGS